MRVVPKQPDLFPTAQGTLFAAPDGAVAVAIDPIHELRALLDKLQNASELPWADAAAAMAEERRALWLAREAGPDGESLAASIFEHTERLFAAAEAA